MRVSIRLLLACGLALLALPCLAQPADAALGTSGFNPRMFDASVPQPERLQLFAHVIALANQGQVRAQDLAGTMYWQGSKIAGSPVNVNLAQASTLLANAAVHGDVAAMAKMAELQLASGNAAAAMVWAQLYAHYLDPTRKARDVHGREYAYAMDLVHRINAAGGHVDAATRSNVARVMQTYDASIRDGIKAMREDRRSGNPHLVMYPQGETPKNMMNSNGVAEFMVAFNPDGSFKQAWMLASWPNDALGSMLRTWLARARVNAVGDGAGPRYLDLVMPHNSHEFHLARPAHVN